MASSTVSSSAPSSKENAGTGLAGFFGGAFTRNCNPYCFPPFVPSISFSKTRTQQLRLRRDAELDRNTRDALSLARSPALSLSHRVPIPARFRVRVWTSLKRDITLLLTRMLHWRTNHCFALLGRRPATGRPVAVSSSVGLGLGLELFRK